MQDMTNRGGSSCTVAPGRVGGRRRFISICAAVAGLASVPAWARQAAAPEMTHRWQGIALGADASLEIRHPDAVLAQRVLAQVQAELERLEQLFSLYRPDSALVALNQQGVLAEPAGEMLTLLSESVHFGQLTDGAFDISVQPLWRVYADHFSETQADPAGPTAAALAAAREKVDYRRIALDSDAVRLQPGMALTLNGIAQGYVTDRIVALLRQAGIEHALVDMGEIYGMAPETVAPWRVGLQDAARLESLSRTLDVANQAVATSGGYGTPLDMAGRFNHLFDPRTGLTGRRYASVSVAARRATTADAMSTAFSLMSEAQIDTLAQSLQLDVYVQHHDGRRAEWRYADPAQNA